jgi:hypothetical protein
MKKIILFLIIAGGVFATACKKENANEVKADKLKGSWEATKTVYTYYENDKEIERDEDLATPKKDVYVFAGDSLLLYRYDERTNDRYTYTLNGDNLNVREGNYTTHLKLKWYNDQQIGIYEEDVNVNQAGVKETYIDETIFVKK